MTNETKQSTRKLSYIVDEFRKLDPEMPAQRMATFLTIAMREGLAVVEMANLTGQSNASSTRNLQGLGSEQVPNRAPSESAHAKIGKTGLGLVRLEADPGDGRRKNCYLTPAGQALLQRIAHHMEG